MPKLTWVSHHHSPVFSSVYTLEPSCALARIGAHVICAAKVGWDTKYRMQAIISLTKNSTPFCRGKSTSPLVHCGVSIMASRRFRSMSPDLKLILLVGARLSLKKSATMDLGTLERWKNRASLYSTSLLKGWKGFQLVWVYARLLFAPNEAPALKWGGNISSVHEVLSAQGLSSSAMGSGSSKSSLSFTSSKTSWSESTYCGNGSRLLV